MTVAAKNLFLNPNPISSEELSKQEEKFFASVQLSNGVFKTTCSHRMDELNKGIMHFIPNNTAGINSFLDIGVSSGIATYEWFQDLKSAGIQARMVATDLTISAYLIRMMKGIYVLADKNGYPLQYDIFGRVCRNWGRRLDYITGYCLLRLLFKLIFNKRRILKKIRAGELKEENNSKEFFKIKLISPSLKNISGIEFVDDDIIHEDPDGFKDQFDMVRVANLLNLCYFSEDQIINSLRRIRERFMKPGSLLLVTSTEPKGQNHATLFCLEDNDSFRAIFRCGDGSEIESLVTSLS